MYIYTYIYIYICIYIILRISILQAGGDPNEIALRLKDADRYSILEKKLTGTSSFLSLSLSLYIYIHIDR